MEEYLSYTTSTVEHVSTKEPQLVTRETVASADGYMIRLLQLGAIEGALGEMDISPVMKPVLEAMHHILSGGDVEIKVVAAGNPLLVQELNRRLDEATQELNAINQRAGYSVLPRT